MLPRLIDQLIPHKFHRRHKQRPIHGTPHKTTPKSILHSNLIRRKVSQLVILLRLPFDDEGLRHVVYRKDGSLVDGLRREGECEARVEGADAAGLDRGAQGPRHAFVGRGEGGVLHFDAEHVQRVTGHGRCHAGDAAGDEGVADECGGGWGNG